MRLELRMLLSLNSPFFFPVRSFCHILIGHNFYVWLLTMSKMPKNCANIHPWNTSKTIQVITLCQTNLNIFSFSFLIGTHQWKSVKCWLWFQNPQIMQWTWFKSFWPYFVSLTLWPLYYYVHIIQGFETCWILIQVFFSFFNFWGTKQHTQPTNSRFEGSLAQQQP
jgi:hypothetical protein